MSVLFFRFSTLRQCSISVYIRDHIAFKYFAPRFFKDEALFSLCLSPRSHHLDLFVRFLERVWNAGVFLAASRHSLRAASSSMRPRCLKSPSRVSSSGSFEAKVTLRIMEEGPSLVRVPAASVARSLLQHAALALRLLLQGDMLNL